MIVCNVQYCLTDSVVTSLQAVDTVFHSFCLYFYCGTK